MHIDPERCDFQHAWAHFASIPVYVLTRDGKPKYTVWKCGENGYCLSRGKDKPDPKLGYLGELVRRGEEYVFVALGDGEESGAKRKQFSGKSEPFAIAAATVWRIKQMKKARKDKR